MVQSISFDHYYGLFLILCFYDSNDSIFVEARGNNGDKKSQSKPTTGTKTITSDFKKKTRTTAVAREFTTGVFKTTKAPSMTG